MDQMVLEPERKILDAWSWRRSPTWAQLGGGHGGDVPSFFQIVGT